MVGLTQERITELVIAGLEREKQHIDEVIADIRAGQRLKPNTAVETVNGKAAPRKMSAAAKRKISAAMKRRWKDATKKK